MATITFRNDVQATLWEKEISGQISDGFWENARPGDHWKAWCRAQVAVAGPSEAVGRDFLTVRDRYSLTNHDLLDVVGHRMLAYARLCLAFGREKVKALDRALLSLDGNIRRDMLDHDLHVLCVDGINLDVAKRTLDDAEKGDLFSMKDLKHELRDMSKIMKIRRAT